MIGSKPWRFMAAGIFVTVVGVGLCMWGTSVTHFPWGLLWCIPSWLSGMTGAKLFIQGFEMRLDEYFADKGLADEWNDA